MVSIQWFPGHMAKAKRLLLEHIKLVDVVIELRDARIPLSSANPLLAEIIGAKSRLIVLTKADLSNKQLTKEWVKYFASQGVQAEAVVLPGSGVSRQILPAVRKLAEPRLPRDKVSGVPLRAVRTMVAGIPNVGKSSLINALAGRAAAKTGAMPGVTKAKQWIKLSEGVELLDTPGLLWPKLEDPEVAHRLAITGAIGRGGFDELELAAWLLRFLATHHPELLDRYKLEDKDLPDYGLLEAVGRKRGCLVSGGKVDFTRTAEIVLSEFRTGKMGAISLDVIPREDESDEVQ